MDTSGYVRLGFVRLGLIVFMPYQNGMKNKFVKYDVEMESSCFGQINGTNGIIC